MDGIVYKCKVMYPPDYGMSAEEPASANLTVQGLCDKVKTEFLEKAGINAATFEPVKYKSQDMTGEKYFVKVNIGDQYYHLKIYDPHTPEKPTLMGFQDGKTEKDEIEYF
ncbi:cystatin-A2-like [Anomaloglossus baeobatrachus]|uniref:cystatin-A2-like n=1 Tax=Anomaloglossus baeobatrachus TaxID=238106 RepID=UPI003F4FB561